MSKEQIAAVRSVDELCKLMRKGLRPKFIFFWGHTPRVPGRVDQSCFSNWYPAPFVVDGVRYATTEHYMMAEKARLFSDPEVLGEVLKASGPGKAKALGRAVKGFDEQVWKMHRLEIVIRGNMGKFSGNKGLREVLLRTGTRVLVEASPHDRIWGMGMSRDDERVEKPHRWNGLNLLGFALMEVRTRLVETVGPSVDG